MIRGDAAREMLAWMSMYEPMRKLGISKDSRVEARRIRTVNRDDPFAKSVSTGRVSSPRAAYETSNVARLKSHPSNKFVVLVDCDELLSTGLCYYDEGGPETTLAPWMVILNSMDIERWKCAANLFIENPPSGIWTEFEDLLATHSSEWPPLFGKKGKIDLLIGSLFTTAGFVYGGLHALPWSSDFLTGREKRLWQASVIIIISLGPLVVISFPVFALMEFVNLEYKKAKSEGRVPKLKKLRPLLRRLFRFWRIARALIKFVSSAAVAAVCVAYCLARVFLVVESLVALFHSDPDIFLVPSWSTYFPHIV